MSNFLVIIFVIGSGVYFNKLNILPKNFGIGINKILIYFFIPILTLLYLPELRFRIEHLWLLVTPWIIYLGSIIFFYLLNRIKKFDKNILGALIMTSGIGSISFVGIPIFEMLYGNKGIEYGIILSLGGTFVVCNSIGIITGLWFKSDTINYKNIVKEIFTFPPFVIMLASLALMLLNYQHTPFIKSVLTKLISPFSVLAFFAIGFQIDFKGFKNYKKAFFVGNFYKLLIAPFIIFLILIPFEMHNSIIGQISILGAGIGSMNTISIIAANFNLKPKLALLMPALGIPISILTIIFIYYLIQ